MQMQTVGNGESLQPDKVSDLKQLESEERRRKLSGPAALLVASISIAFALFHLYTAQFGMLMTMQQRIVHVTFALVLAFLLQPFGRRSSRTRVPLYDAALVLLVVVSGAYIFLQAPTLELRMGTVYTSDIVFGAITLLLVLEAARRLIGWPLPIIVVILLAYAYFGYLIPPPFGHRGFDIERTVSFMYLTLEGIYGMPIGVSSTFVVLFVIFGAFLQESGGGEFFTKLAFAGFGRSRGGPAKVAIVASGLFGTISGSAVANVVSTGAFTIPMMKKVGYRPHFAGAVEAVSSTGGQLMPPVMGAAAFVMAEVLGMPYAQLIVAAALPAVLYYLAIFAAVHLEAVRLGLVGLPRDQLPRVRAVMKESWPLAIPPMLLIYLLVVLMWSPMKAAFWTIVAMVAVSMLKKETRMSPRTLARALEKGGQGILDVAAASASAGVVMGVITLSGLGLKFATILVDLSGGNLLALLVLTMVASLVLGMALPTVACYIILAVLVGPALTRMGVEPLVAHMFIFYFGIISVITPPVALAAYVGAGLAGADPMRTGFTATRLGIAAFILPYMFVYGPALLLRGTPEEVAVATATATVGIIALAGGLQGHLLQPLNKLERLLMVGGALALIKPGLTTDAIGLLIVGAVVARQIVMSRAAQARPTNIGTLQETQS